MHDQGARDTELTFSALVAVDRPNQDELGRGVQYIPEHAEYVVTDWHREVFFMS